MDTEARPRKPDWRDRLTRDEKRKVRKYDTLLASLGPLRAEVSMIRNRAIQRGRYDQKRKG